MLIPNIPVRLEIKVTPGGSALPRYFFKKNGTHPATAALRNWKFA
jgi:hypothetical protein